MPLPWKKSKSGRISRFVSDLQQSPKASLVVETGFPTSLIDLFVKNRDRLKKQQRNNNNNKTPTIHSISTRKRVSSPPPPLQRHKSLPVNLNEPTDVPLTVEEIVITNEPLEEEKQKENGESGGNGGGGCVLMIVAVKVFIVAVLALSTKRLAVGITLSAFTLIFLEFAVARVFTILNLCPHARVRLCTFIGNIIGKQKVQEEERQEERKNRVTFEIIEPKEIRLYEDTTLVKEKEKIVEVQEEEVETVVLKKEKSKSSKFKSKIVKKIVPKKLRSYKKKKKMKSKEEEEEIEVIEIIGEDEYEEESGTEVSSLFSDDRIGSEISERDEPLLEILEEEVIGGRGDVTKAMVLIVIVLVGLLNGKVLAICLTLSSCLILRLVCCNKKSETSLC